MTQVSSRIATVIVAVAIVVAGWIGVSRYKSLRRQRLEAEVSAAADSHPMRVPLWLPPADVRHHHRFASLWDGPAPLARFRQGNECRHESA